MTKSVIPAIGPEFLERDGLAPEPATWEDGLRADTGPGSFEWWYFDAHFDDGSTAVIVYATKPLLERRGPLKPMLSFAITRPDGTKVGTYPLYPPGDFHAAWEQCDVRIGPNWAHGDLHRYELHAEAEAGGMAADLIFTGIVPPWRPGTGKNYYDDALTRYFAWLPAIPFGTVEGALTYGGQTRRVTGTGYHDHNWGNIGLDQVMSHWYWGRAHLGDFTIIFVEMVSTQGYGGVKLPVLMLAKGDRILAGDGRSLALQTQDFVRHSNGRTYPQALDWHWQTAGETVHLALRRPQVIEAASLLGFLPRWQQWLGRLLTNPYYFRFRADVELAIDLGEVRATEHGEALYELMILR
jgi:hypothetical protein